MALASFKFRTVQLNQTAILAQAQAKTGLSDFDPEDFKERLQVLITQYQHDDGLTNLGKHVLKGHLVRYATNRLLIRDQLKKNPDAADAVKQPLIVVGMPRTGTTHMLNLLGADTRFQSLPLWLSEEPFNLPGQQTANPLQRLNAIFMSAITGGLKRGEHDLTNNDPRYLRGCVRWALMQWNAPHISAMHPMNPDHIHEECELGCNDFNSYQFEWSSLAPAWRDYYLSHDQSANYHYIKQVLGLIQIERDEDKPWVLKCPQHMEQLPVLKKTFPDATLVMTHRDPVAVIQSAATMIAYAQRIMRKTVDVKIIIDYWIERIERLLQAGVRDRHLWKPENSIDVPFDYFMKHDMAVVERIYDLYGMPLTRTAREQMQAFIDAHPRGKFGTIRYNLKDNFNVDPDAIRERFSFYYDAFDLKNLV